MSIEVQLDDLIISATTVHEEVLNQNGKGRRKLSIDFRVSNEQYHEVTSKLYENDFTVKVVEKGLAFPAEIFNYYTSITNLYNQGAVGDFHLELIERSLAE